MSEKAQSKMRVARASELGYGSQGLCPFCENEDCDRWSMYHSHPLVEWVGVVEWCPTSEKQGYKNKKDGF